MRGAVSAALLAVLWSGAPLTAASAASASTTSANSTAVPPTDSSSQDIRDIRGPKVIFPAWIVPALLAGAAMLVLGTYAVWRWTGRRPAVQPLLPFEIALQRLEGVRPLMQPSSVREFSIAITDIVRHYIEQRFEVTAAHRTTEEFLHDLLESTKDTLAVHRNVLAEFLHQCDLAKFAGMSLSNETMESLYRSARTFILATAEPVAAIEESPAALSAT